MRELTGKAVDAGLDFEGLRAMRFSDPPYVNVVEILSAIRNAPGAEASSHCGFSPAEIADEVECHWIARRHPAVVVAGLDRALAVLRECAGFINGAGRFVSTSDQLTVQAVTEGTRLEVTGGPRGAPPILVVRGTYEHFAHLKTPMLGVLARASRVATNVYEALRASRGKPVYMFSARYDPPEVQALDGWAYHVGVQRFNSDTGLHAPDVVSTLANAEWFGGGIEGTISHEAIACFLGDAARLMLRFCEILPPDRLRVALIDYHNDCVATAREVLATIFQRHRRAVMEGDAVAARKYRIDGVRIDTSAELLDLGIVIDSQPEDYGPSPKLVTWVREAMDEVWRDWPLDAEWVDHARDWCRGIKIIVSGGVSASKIGYYEASAAPIDAYGVGAALLNNCSTCGGLTDFSAMIMRVRSGSTWIDLPKAGRQPNENPLLREICFSPDSE